MPRLLRLVDGSSEDTSHSLARTITAAGKGAIAGFVAGLVGSMSAVAVVRRITRMEVVGRSMTPILQPGDRVLVFRGGRLRAGDLVAVLDPRQPSRTVIKRVEDFSRAAVILVGDNREASTDSRIFGPVPTASVRGRAFYRYWPLHRTGWLRRNERTAAGVGIG